MVLGSLDLTPITHTMFNKAVTRFALSLVLGVALVASLLSACSRTSDYSLDEQHFTAASLKLVESKTGLSFPKGSRGLNMFYRGSQIDPSFAAKVKVPLEAEAAMRLQVTSIANVEISVSGKVFENLEWWRPSQGTILVERQFNGPDGYYVHVILCSQQGDCVAYIEWASM